MRITQIDAKGRGRIDTGVHASTAGIQLSVSSAGEGTKVQNKIECHVHDKILLGRRQSKGALVERVGIRLVARQQIILDGGHLDLLLKCELN